MKTTNLSLSRCGATSNHLSLGGGTLPRRQMDFFDVESWLSWCWNAQEVRSFWLLQMVLPFVVTIVIPGAYVKIMGSILTNFVLCFCISYNMKLLHACWNKIYLYQVTFIVIRKTRESYTEWWKSRMTNNTAANQSLLKIPKNK